MQSYQIPLVPGPVSVPTAVRAAYAIDYASADLEDDFFALYDRCTQKLQTVLGASTQVTIQTGEGMLALWGALKSVVKPGDRVLAVGTGLFGYGIGDMARQLGAEVEVVGFPFDSIVDPQPVREAALRFRPKLVTAVHCETPSGTLNPLADLGQICREVDALFYVDFVASGGGVPVEVDRCAIDLGLLGSQKVLSLPPDLSMVTVSDRAWEVIAAVGYVGYDALTPWRIGPAQKYLPYTHNWSALAALEISLDLLLAEGLEQVYARHTTVAAACRRALDAMGVRLFAAQEAFNAPTVTAAYVPDGWTWPDLDRSLRAHGMAVGGNYGELAGKVFRIGHMGSQANLALLTQGMDVLRRVLG